MSLLTRTILLWCYGMFNVIVVVEHSIGFLLLYRRRREFSLLLFFSSCNLIYACVNIGFFAINAAECPKFITDVYTIYATLLRIPFYWLMIMLTLERFLVVFIHLKYNNSWFDRNKERLCIASWIVYIGFSIAVHIVYIKQHSGNFYNNLLRTNYTLLGHLLIFVIFVTVYGYIYWKIRVLKMQVAMGERLETKRWKIFVPFFIVFSFLLFRGITELVAVFYLKRLEIYIVWIYSFDFFVNGIVYIFMQPILRRDFKKMFCKSFRRVSPTPNSSSAQRHSSFAAARLNSKSVKIRLSKPNINDTHTQHSC